MAESVQKSDVMLGFQTDPVHKSANQVVISATSCVGDSGGPNKKHTNWLGQPKGRPNKVRPKADGGGIYGR